MKTAARAILLAASLAGVVVPSALIVGPALPGHLVNPWWISAQPHVQATGIGECNKAAQLYRLNPDTVIPPGCENRGGFKRLLPPPGDTPPPPQT
jgi:hypothetical protein